MTLSKFSYLPSFPKHFFFQSNRYSKFTWSVFNCDTFSPDWTCWRGCCKARLHREWDKTVADPNGGEGSSRPWDKGGGRYQKIVSALLASVWSKNKRWGGGGGLEGPPGPSPCSATAEIRWNSPPRAFSKNYYMELERELLRMTELFTP